MRRIRTNDAGFTLPELLVAIVAVGIVVPALANAFVTGVRTTTGTTERLAASNDAVFASSWFVPDVQSAESFSTTCATLPGGTTHLLTMSRTDGASPVAVGYGWGGSPLGLRRYPCTTGTAEPTITVAHSLKSVGLPVCTPSPCNNLTTKVALSVTTDDGSDAGYTFYLNATRRTS